MLKLTRRERDIYQPCFDKLIMILEAQTEPYVQWIKRWMGFEPKMLESLFYLATDGLGKWEDRLKCLELHTEHLVKIGYLKRKTYHTTTPSCSDKFYFTTWPYEEESGQLANPGQLDLIKIVGPLLNFESFTAIDYKEVAQQLGKTPAAVRAMLDQQLCDTHCWRPNVVERAGRNDPRYRLTDAATRPILVCDSFCLPNEILSNELATQLAPIPWQ